MVGIHDVDYRAARKVPKSPANAVVRGTVSEGGELISILHVLAAPNDAALEQRKSALGVATATTKVALDLRLYAVSSILEERVNQIHKLLK